VKELPDLMGKASSC